MTVAVMEIGHVSVFVLQMLVAMRMGMWFGGLIPPVFVLVVLIMSMAVVVLQRFMNVAMGVLDAKTAPAW